ncbi:MAG: class I SAM-dependent methyltransferase [Deltaproteobacteria bacterium]|nr:class I SAM-dependent methyltransferase [Deltaproteobacteria bacterium]
MKNIACEVCGSDQYKFLFKGWDRIFGIPGEFNLIQCEECRLLFINPQPGEEVLKKHYPKAYYTPRTSQYQEYSWLRKRALEEYFGYGECPHSSKVISLFRKMVLWPLKVRYRNSIPFIPNGYVLDIGCSNGTELYKLKKMGWETYGVEMDEEASKRARSKGISVFTGGLLEANFPDQFFDVVRMSFVLEHLPNPRETLVEIKRILKPRGRIFLSVQNAGSLHYWLFGERWFSLDIPRHLFSFSVETLRKLLSSLDLKIQIIRFDSGTRTFLASLQYWVNDRHEGRALIRGNQSIYGSHLLRYLFRPFCWFVDRIRLGDLIHLEIMKT